jgi:hypothetical protein
MLRRIRKLRKHTRRAQRARVSSSLLALQAPEPQCMLDAAPFEFDATAGTPSDVTLELDGTNLVFVDNSDSTELSREPLFDISEVIVIEAGHGDSFTIDLSSAVIWQTWPMHTGAGKLMFCTAATKASAAAAGTPSSSPPQV